MTAHILTRSSARVQTQGTFGAFRRFLEIRKQRKSLASLDERVLNDLGLTRREALQEATRAPWDVPANWLKPHSC